MPGDAAGTSSSVKDGHMHTRNITIGRQTLSIETGRLAKQADGAVVVRSGDTMVLVTACAAANPREGIDFLPLTVDYRDTPTRPAAFLAASSSAKANRARRKCSRAA